MSFSGFKTGVYIPKGKCSKTKLVKYRSSYELAFCKLLDAAAVVVAWEYEQYYIGYDFQQRHHHYLLDFFIVLSNGEKYAIEIKPKTFYDRAMTMHDRNWAKWNACIAFCNRQGWHFKVITEQTIPVLRRAWLRQ